MRAAFRSTGPTPGNRRALSSFLSLSLCPCSVGPKEPGTAGPPSPRLAANWEAPPPPSAALRPGGQV